MKKLLFLMMLFTAPGIAQELKLVRATMQTVNYGASPGSETTYYILLQKRKRFAWSVDSVCGIQSGQQVKYRIAKVDDPDVLSPNYSVVRKFHRKDTGKYMIRFSIHKDRGGSGRPGNPPHIRVDTTNIEGGVLIHYHAKKKRKVLKVDEFEKLETVDAP